jgi:hypothetical protein
MQELAAAARMATRLEGTGEDDPGPPLVPAVKEKIIAYFDASRAWAGQCALKNNLCKKRGDFLDHCLFRT